MEKAITFSTEQKKLIWDRVVAPNNGTKEEADHFIEIAESFGLNPLLNDIIFQKYGNRPARFITTRDGLLRVATGQKGYVGAPNANVVKEGDTFRFNPSEGDVYHEFGTKRGKILGAYAVMQHKHFNSVAFFADFEEYFNALSGVKRGGRPNVWDTMPSSMIIKIAEVFVIRRQFPLGGLYTQEEMFLEDDGNYVHATEHINNTQQQQQNQNQSVNNAQPQQREQIQVGNQQNNVNQGQANPNVQNQDGKRKFLVKEQVDQLNAIASEIATVRNVDPSTVLGALGKPLAGFEANEFNEVQNQLNDWLQKAKEETNEQPTQTQTANNQPEQQGQVSKEGDQSSSQETFVMGKQERIQTPSGTDVIKFSVQGKEDTHIFAREPQILEVISGINEGDTFSGTLVEERGFTFIVSVNTNVEQSA